MVSRGHRSGERPVVSEGACSPGERDVASQQRRAAFVAGGDDVEEEIGLPRLNGTQLISSTVRSWRPGTACLKYLQGRPGPWQSRAASSAESR